MTDTDRRAKHRVRGPLGYFDRLSTHLQFLSVILVIVGLSMGVLALGQSRLNQVRHHLAVAQASLEPATRALGAAETDARLGLEYSTRYIAGDLSIAAAGNQAQTDQGKAWAEYRKSAVGLPGEKALAADYDAAQAEFTKLEQNVLANLGSTASAEALLPSLNKMVADLAQLGHLYQSALTTTVNAAQNDLDSARTAALAAMAVALMIVLVLSTVALHLIKARESDIARSDDERQRDALRGDLETRLQRALELVGTEEAAFRVIERGVRLAAPGVPAELLVADSSRAHFRQVAVSDENVPGCPVSSPMECPAVNRGQTQVWSSSDDLDSCVYLQDSPGGKCSAACVPVSIAGKTVGVLHAVGPEGEPPQRELVENLELVARKAGERTGMLRAFARSETQAHTDALTGLVNRRSLETQLRDLTDDGRPFVVAFGDLDHFKLLNDVHGHDAGDRALRLFARVVRDNVRPNDIAARYGGEEFVIALPECSISDAYVVLERIRDRLAEGQHDGTVPPFTVSFGIATSKPEVGYSETIDSADHALLDAKQQGRDRIVLAGSAHPDEADELVSPIPAPAPVPS
jgi:diguanylate cyclase (GGDEF)-like protein